MEEVLLVIHLMIAAAMVVVVLLQRSEGGALGIGGGGGGGLMTNRSAANLLTRTTAILAGLFFLTSISMAMLAKSNDTRSILAKTGFERALAREKQENKKTNGQTTQKPQGSQSSK